MHLTSKKLSCGKTGPQKEAIRARISAALRKIEDLIARAKARNDTRGTESYADWLKELHVVRNGLPNAGDKESMLRAEESVSAIEKYVSMGESINPAAPILAYSKSLIKSAIESFRERVPDPDKNENYEDLTLYLKFGIGLNDMADMRYRISELNKIPDSNPPFMNKVKKPEPDGAPNRSSREPGRHDPPPFTHGQNSGNHGNGQQTESKTSYIVVHKPKNPILLKK